MIEISMLTTRESAYSFTRRAVEATFPVFPVAVVCGPDSLAGRRLRPWLRL